jgi:hypothetical protein
MCAVEVEVEVSGPNSKRNEICAWSDLEYLTPIHIIKLYQRSVPPRALSSMSAWISLSLNLRFTHPYGIQPGVQKALPDLTMSWD